MLGSAARSTCRELDFMIIMGLFYDFVAHMLTSVC